ncbi:RraA family protein [Ammoniphilus resinae]|uniref:Putative 4-hydroxy-4-methyl-2-oxoglutarate aldolase n=1 Tax=Ammoniphilus resinae TaxID=861532 RepID=A0ABS4GNT9_9BACL|nr:RraA family protein [Ammoniphilus resinae]MBP1931928.1 regulator of RNase E activity RraA [Ammoniphilus resinae]
MTERLSKDTLLKLRRYNSPTIYNGWEQITKQDVTKGNFNLDEVKDFMPQLGPMVGYAVTLVIEPSNIEHKKHKVERLREYRKYIASVPGPKIVVVKDLDKVHVGSFWGEVNATIHRSLGCVGTIVDGAVRDVDEMAQAGLKALAKRLCVGHAHVTPIDWNCEVEVFGCKIKPGELIHADQHGFLTIPQEDEGRLLEAAEFMDQNEMNTVIPSAWNTAGKSTEEILAEIERGGEKFRSAMRSKFQKDGEW